LFKLRKIDTLISVEMNIWYPPDIKSKRRQEYHVLTGDILLSRVRYHNAIRAEKAAHVTWNCEWHEQQLWQHEGPKLF
jgi:hypothetical protein